MGNQDDVLDAGLDRLIDDVLDERLVGSISLGIAFVAGSILVPSPATGMTARVTLTFAGI